MTTPVAADNSAILSQILLKQGEMGEKLAVISEQLKDIPDHENRIRRLEDARAKLVGAAAAVSALVSALGTWIGIAVTRH